MWLKTCLFCMKNAWQTNGFSYNIVYTCPFDILFTVNTPAANKLQQVFLFFYFRHSQKKPYLQQIKSFLQTIRGLNKVRKSFRGRICRTPHKLSARDRVLPSVCGHLSPYKALIYNAPLTFRVPKIHNTHFRQIQSVCRGFCRRYGSRAFQAFFSNTKNSPHPLKKPYFCKPGRRKNTNSANLNFGFC